MKLLAQSIDTFIVPQALEQSYLTRCREATERAKEEEQAYRHVTGSDRTVDKALKRACKAFRKYDHDCMPTEGLFASRKVRGSTLDFRVQQLRTLTYATKARYPETVEIVKALENGAQWPDYFQHLLNGNMGMSLLYAMGPLVPRTKTTLDYLANERRRLNQIFGTP